MTSAAKTEANRRNSRQSRGPATKTSKACVSRNAIQHGLASLTHRDPDFAIETERIAKSLCGKDGNPLLFESALVIAESELLLRGVRTERVAAIERMRDLSVTASIKRDGGMMRARARIREVEEACAQEPQIQARIDALSETEQDKMWDALEAEEEEQRAGGLKPHVHERDEFEAMRMATPDLNRLERYERRACSRLRRAILRFMSVKFMNVNQAPGA